MDKRLPEDLGAEFDAKMGDYEEVCKMERVTSTERRANDGRTTGERRGIKKGGAKRGPGA
jgi:hypothetical protein